MRQIVLGFLVVCIIGISSIFALDSYRDEVLIQKYTIYVEERIGDKIDTLSVKNRLDILYRIESLLTTYPEQDIPEAKKIVIMNMLYAVQAYIEWSFESQTPALWSEITVRIIDDIRCTWCQTSVITAQIKALPFLSEARYIEEDFSDTWVAEYLKANNITALPVVVFSTNMLSDGGQVVPYLSALPDGQYTLALGASFDPFERRSARGFPLLEKEILDSILQDSYIKGFPDAQITWIEYTDVNCHFCRKMEQDGTAEAVLTAYPSYVNKTSHHFIGVGGQKSQLWAELIECVWKVAGSDVYNAVLSETLISGDTTETDILNHAEWQWVERDSVQSCFAAGETKDIVASRFAVGQEVFNITWTPGNILIHTKTWEYTTISWAYPYESFVEAIEDLLIK